MSSKMAKTFAGRSAGVAAASPDRDNVREATAFGDGERDPMTSVLVTGGCGFIGSNFIHHLLETDPAVAVLNLDSLTYAGNLANLAGVEGGHRYHFLRGDVGDRHAARGAVHWGRR